MQYATTQPSINEVLPVLARNVLENGEEVGSRNGRCKELTHVSVQLTEPWRREILLPSRRASLPAQIAETMWILSGRNDIEWLSHYLARAKDFSDDGKTWRGGYGPRIRKWVGTDGNGWEVERDQLAHVVDLLRRDPVTRRAVIAIYDPLVDTADGKDIPCNNWLHFLNRGGKLDLAVTIRSNDLIWGWSGINAFEWSALLEIVAGLVGVGVGSLTFHISSLHIYEKHWQRARQIAEDPPTVFPEAPRFSWDDDTAESLDPLIQRWFAIEGHLRNGTLTDPSAVAAFPEPMMRSWLKVLQWWWGPYDDPQALEVIGNNALMLAAIRSPNRPRSGHLALDDPRVGGFTGPAQNVVLHHTEVAPAELAAAEDTELCDAEPTFIETDAEANTARFRAEVIKLHTAKDKAYGDSWRRRGETVGILANIARKVDRLGVTDEHETAADTAIDLMLYLVKYRLWLWETLDAPRPTVGPYGSAAFARLQHAEQVAAVVDRLGADHATRNEFAGLEADLKHRFEALLGLVDGVDGARWRAVDGMITTAALLARSRWADSVWKSGNAVRSWNPDD